MRTVVVSLLLVLLLATSASAWMKDLGGGFTLRLEGATPATYYDFNEKALLAGLGTTILEYKIPAESNNLFVKTAAETIDKINLDVGAIGDARFASPTLGVGTNAPGKLLSKCIYKLTGVHVLLEDKVKAGAYNAYDFNKELYRYGFYVGVKINISF